MHGVPIFDRLYTVRTTASSQSSAFKQQIHDQLSAATPFPDGPVWLQLAFTVGPQRNWTNLWKPTIEALDPILGRTTVGRSWHPRDGRIIELGLHCHVDTVLATQGGDRRAQLGDLPPVVTVIRNGGTRPCAGTVEAGQGL